MISYTFYDDSGKITKTAHGSVESMAKFIENKQCIQGNYSAEEYFIKDSLPVKIPAKPKDSIIEYTFLHDVGHWIPDIKKTIFKIRQIRTEMLLLVDKVNPVRYADLSDQQRQELADFRTNLLNITDQEDYPLKVVFPEKPAWL